MYMYDVGMSMTTPLISGCAALVRQALRQNSPQEAAGGTQYSPSASRVKAVLIDGAVKLKGQYHPNEVGPSPNYNSD